MIESETRQANWRRASPAKYDAHLAVQRALKSGLFEKESCEVCGTENVDAHHDQYSTTIRSRSDGYAGAATPGSIITAKTCFHFVCERYVQIDARLIALG